MAGRPLKITQRQLQAAIKAGKAEGVAVVECKIGDVVILYKPTDPNSDGTPVDDEPKGHL